MYLNQYGLGTYYNNNVNPWEYYSATSNDFINSGVGLSIKATTASDLTFTGSLITTNSFIGINTGTTNTGTTDGFNLIGNPYTAYVNSTDFLSQADNANAISQQTIWLWDGTSYTVANLINPIEIAPGQGFFVEDDATVGGLFGFYATNRSHQSTNTFLRQEVAPNFELTINNGTKETATKVFYADAKTTGFDNGYDSKMFGGTTYDLAVYTQLVTDNQGDNLAIQTLPTESLTSTIIPVGIIAKANEEITFSAESVNLPKGTNVYLEDTVNGEFVNLSETNYKTTLTEDADTIGQFYIHTSAKSLSTDAVTDLHTVSIYQSSNNQVTITGLNEDASVNIYSLLGKQVASTNLTANGVNTINLASVATGVYIVKLATQTAEITKKITIK